VSSAVVGSAIRCRPSSAVPLSVDDGSVALTAAHDSRRNDHRTGRKYAEPLPPGDACMWRLRPTYGSSTSRRRP
jgi:hypothetical protein